MTSPVYNVLWIELQNRAANVSRRILDLGLKDVRLYGVPRGGVPAAMLVYNCLQQQGVTVSLVERVEWANVVVDDLLDSGTTRDRYIANTGLPFFVLLDKPKEDLHATWITFPWEESDGSSGPEDAVVRLLEFIGEDVHRDGLKDTPKRVIRSYAELFGGYQQSPESVMTVFDQPYDEMVVLKGLEFQSTCEHHMLPFVGVAHIAYVPKDRVIGVSKLARLLDIYAKRLQIQERICQQVTAALDQFLEPLGSACVLDAKHMCMSCRGVRKQDSSMITSSLTGVFREATVRAEFFSMIK